MAQHQQDPSSAPNTQETSTGTRPRARDQRRRTLNTDPTFRQLLSKVANYRQHRPADDPDRVAAEQALTERCLAQKITTLVDQAPKLTPQQITRLSALLVKRDDSGGEV